MARGLPPPVGSRSGSRHLFIQIAGGGLATASQPNGGKPPRHSCSSCRACEAAFEDEVLAIPANTVFLKESVV
ncbi:hypothetical protein F6R97_01400 [Pseudomonas sp. JV414]|nr:hypothetical protein [Pseudomonas sp. JV414]